MATSEAGFTTKMGVLARKDLRVEARGRDTLPPMLAFSFAVVLVLAFTVPEEGDIQAAVLGDILAGFLWITILFAGLIGFARTFEIEREEGAIDALLLVPVDRSGLFLAKAIANLVFILVVELFIVPVFALLFDLEVGSWPLLLLVLLLGDLGFVVIGTLFSSIAAQTRSRELMLPLLALPALVPVFIASVELTSDLFAGAGLSEITQRGWFGILLAFDLLFAIVGSLVFEFAID
ncbi:MAG: heme exporter protein CcmB [Actinomycetota bacterium]|nr:heme exporter protein CcmB [Actinomycetota bacterium]